MLEAAPARPNAPRQRWSSRRAAPFAPPLLAVVLVTSVVAAQQRVETLAVWAYTFEHKPAGAALVLVERLLSPRGTVELQVANNTLVVRDNPSVLAKVEALIRDLDHPPRRLRLDVLIVHASRTAPKPATRAIELPEWLMKGLGKLLRFNSHDFSYDLLARASLTPREGELVEYGLGQAYRVRFRTGNVIGAQLVRLQEFEVLKVEREKPLLDPTTFNISLGKPFLLNLARDEASEESLVVALICQLGEEKATVSER